MHYLLFIIFSLFFSSCVAEEKQTLSNELIILDRLIEATQQSLEQQQALRIMIKQYQELLSNYVNDMDNNELLFRVAKKAQEVSDYIKINHLDHTFDPAFLSELSLFTKVASKNNVPPPN